MTSSGSPDKVRLSSVRRVRRRLRSAAFCSALRRSVISSYEDKIPTTLFLRSVSGILLMLSHSSPSPRESIGVSKCSLGTPVSMMLRSQASCISFHSSQPSSSSLLPTMSSGRLSPTSLANRLLQPRYFKFWSFQYTRTGNESSTSRNIFCDENSASSASFRSVISCPLATMPVGRPSLSSVRVTYHASTRRSPAAVITSFSKPRLAVQGLGRRIEFDDLAFRAEIQHDALRRLDKRAKTLVAFEQVLFRLLALADVDDDAVEAPARTRLRLLPDPPRHMVCVDEAVLHRIGLLIAQAVAPSRLHRGEVVRVYQSRIVERVAEQRLRCIAGDGLDWIADVCERPVGALAVRLGAEHRTWQIVGQSVEVLNAMGVAGHDVLVYGWKRYDEWGMPADTGLDRPASATQFER